MAQVFPLFENVNDGRRTPAVNILDRLGSVHTLVKSCQMYRWNFNLVLGEPGGDLMGAFHEFYARDTSRKIKSVFKAKGMSGKHLTGTVIYGYLWDEGQSAAQPPPSRPGNA